MGCLSVCTWHILVPHTTTAGIQSTYKCCHLHPGQNVASMCYNTTSQTAMAVRWPLRTKTGWTGSIRPVCNVVYGLRTVHGTIGRHQDITTYRLAKHSHIFRRSIITMTMMHWGRRRTNDQSNNLMTTWTATTTTNEPTFTKSYVFYR